MSLLEIIWFLTGLAIISIILITDPKSSSSAYSNNPVGSLFSNTAAGTNTVQKINWFLILVFLLLTMLLSFLT